MRASGRWGNERRQSAIEQVTVTNRTLAIRRLSSVVENNVGQEMAFTRLIDEYIERLAACGCRVRVETVA